MSAESLAADDRAQTASSKDVVVTMLEFWPDYGSGPLWMDGAPVDPSSLGLTDPLLTQLAAWNGQYDESRLPLEGPGDHDWLAEGARLLREVRAGLVSSCAVVVTEPWWGEEARWAPAPDAL